DCETRRRSLGSSHEAEQHEHALVRLSAARLGTRIRDEPVTVRHHDLRQAHGVYDLILANDAVQVQNIGNGRVDLRRLEQARLIEWHRPIDVIPYRRLLTTH